MSGSRSRGPWRLPPGAAPTADAPDGGGLGDDDRGPVDPAPAGPRPALAALAAMILVAMGLGLMAITILDLVDLARVYLAEDFVDGMTALVTSVMAAVAAAMMLAVVAVGAAMVLAAARIWRRVRWAWIEGTAAAVAGALFAVVGLVSVEPGDRSVRASLELAVAGASLVGAFVVVGALVVARPWFGRLYRPRTNREAPFWLRRDWLP